jgi:hypothetical protein
MKEKQRGGRIGVYSFLLYDNNNFACMVVESVLIKRIRRIDVLCHNELYR